MSTITTANLHTQYEAVVGYIREYLNFVLSIIDRSGMKRTKTGVAKLKLSINPFHLPAALQAAAEKVATDEEKSHEFYQVMMSPDQAGSLSDALRKRFPEVNFDRLTKFNNLNEPAISMFDASHMGGMAFGLIGAMLQFMPRSVFEHPLLDVAGFGCYVVAMSIIYPKWAKHSLAKKQHKYETYILSYAAIVEQ